jgi:phage I-like protein
MKKTFLLLSCKAIDAEAPNEIQLIPPGLNVTPKGSFLLDAESAALVLADFATRANDMVIDYEHQTLEGCEAPAAGWVKAMKGLVYRGAGEGGGIWGTGVEWTARATQYFANKEYRYLSPVMQVRNSDKRVISLINVALTNQPNIDGMVPLINKMGIYEEAQPEEGDSMKKIYALLGLAETATEAEVSMAVNKLIQSGAMANKVLTQLGLPLAAEEAAVVTAITTLQGQAAVMANKDVLTALGLGAGATASEATATILAMKQGDLQVTQLIGRVKTLEESLAGRDAGDLITVAVNSGKIAPAQLEWAQGYAKRDPEGFKLFVAKAPVVVPIGTIVMDNDGLSADSLELAQIQVNKLLGIDSETFKKYNPKEV